MSSPSNKTASDGDGDGDGAQNSSLGYAKHRLHSSSIANICSQSPPGQTDGVTTATTISNPSMKQKDLFEQIKTLLPLRQDPETAEDKKGKIIRSANAKEWNVNEQCTAQVSILEAKIHDIKKAAEQDRNRLRKAKGESLAKIEEGLKVAGKIASLLEEANVSIKSRHSECS